MHGHALSGSRKLNRHWQSGSKRGLLDENLVYFERSLEETEWRQSEPPYKTCSSEDGVITLESYAVYNNKNKPRNVWGFKDFVIKEPGDYKVHWELYTRDIETFVRDGETWERLGSGNRDARFGMFGVLMFGSGQTMYIYTQEPYYKVDDGDFKYYVGRAEDYIATPHGGVLDASIFYTNNDIVEYVSPYRTSTASGWLGGTNTFNMNSGTEQPEIILHIGGKAPFTEYSYVKNVVDKTVYFIPNGKYKSPCIRFMFYENVTTYGVISWAILGKIWLERIGDYTDNTDGWLPEILDAPSDWTIINLEDNT